MVPEVKYPNWLGNLVPVKKKIENGEFVDYFGLNK